MITTITTVKTKGGSREIKMLHSNGGLMVHEYLGRETGIDAEGYTISHINGYMLIPCCKSLEVAIAAANLLVAKFGDWSEFKGVHDERCDRNALEERRGFVRKLMNLLGDEEEDE